MIPLLEPYFHVTCVSYDGFDKSEQMAFPDMLAEAEQIGACIQKNFDGHICAAYGRSMDGSFVGLLSQRRNIYIDHGILGSSDLNQGGGLSAKLHSRLIAVMLHGMFQKGMLPGFMKKRLQKKPPEERACL